jgi:ribonuclease P protein subunit RPR2
MFCSRGSQTLMHTTNEWLIEMSSTKQITLQRIHTLFSLAKEVIHENPELAQRYIQIARKIAMRTRMRLPKEYRSLVCRKCKRFILPGVNCRIRIQQRREPHMVITCLHCDGHSRIPLRGRKNLC